MNGAGLALPWSAARHPHRRWPWSPLIGGMLVGWAGFNLVEGPANHQSSGLHHVRPGEDQRAHDLGFLAWSAAMLTGGVVLLRRAADHHAADR